MLTDHGVALLPGTAFGRPSTELTTRLCYVDFDGAKAIDAYIKNGGIENHQFENLFPNIVAGISQLTLSCTPHQVH